MERFKNKLKIDDEDTEVKWGNTVDCENSLQIKFKSMNKDIRITDLEFREYFNLGDPKNIFDAKLIYSGFTFKGYGFVIYKSTPSGKEVCSVSI
jgi:hypothetical protein